jgi:hypothetical protein
MSLNIGNMEFEFNHIKRETLLDPMYKKIDSNGKIYLDKKKAGKEVLVIAVKPMPEDKIKYIKVGR